MDLYGWKKAAEAQKAYEDVVRDTEKLSRLLSESKKALEDVMEHPSSTEWIHLESKEVFHEGAVLVLSASLLDQLSRELDLLVSRLRNLKPCCVRMSRWRFDFQLMIS